jgi:uncharacterized protein YbjT (DUF2867 family)
VILVTGATGNVGRNVVEQLVDAGEEVLQGDLRRPETLRAALRGVDRAFLFPVPGQLRGFLDAAEAALGRLVLLSASAVTFEPPNAIGRMHAECEQVVAESGLPWTFLRPGAFMANDLNWAAGIKAAGVVRGPGGDVSSAPIDERDIAAVAVRALLDDGHAGQAYLLTGQESLTQIERVRILGEVLGRELRFEEETRRTGPRADADLCSRGDRRLDAHDVRRRGGDEGGSVADRAGRDRPGAAHLRRLGSPPRR